MAKNWLMKEAANEILAGNKDAIVDIGRRFPLVSNAIAKMGNNEGAMIIINALPDYISVRKIEAILKDGVQEIEDEGEEVTEVEETKSEKPVKEEKKAKRGKKASKDDDEDFMNQVPDEVEEELNLEAMSEVELFKLAKSRGLKPAPKQKKQYYLDLLNPTDDSEEDDWDDEEEEEKSTKKEKKVKKEDKAAKKEKKASKKDDDEDDDWDI